MTISVDHLRVWSPTATHNTSERVDLVEKGIGKRWFYRVEFDALPEATETTDGGYNNLAVGGEIGGAFFHLSVPLMIWSRGSTDERPVETSVEGDENGK